MASTFADLISFTNRVAIAVRAEEEEVTRKAARAALRTSVRGTPVDEAVARSNWIVTIARGTNRVRAAPFFRTSKAGRAERRNAQAAIAAGDVVIDRYKAGPRGSSEIVIQNNTPYIGLLDDGYSAQAPMGFSQAAEQAALREFRRYRLRGI